MFQGDMLLRILAVVIPRRYIIYGHPSQPSPNTEVWEWLGVRWCRTTSLVHWVGTSGLIPSTNKPGWYWSHNQKWRRKLDPYKQR